MVSICQSFCECQKHDDWLCAQALIRLCAGSTLLFALPVLVKEVLRPSARGLLVCMTSSAFAFYLFSYQARTSNQLLLSLLMVMPSSPKLTVRFATTGV